MMALRKMSVYGLSFGHVRNIDWVQQTTKAGTRGNVGLVSSRLIGESSTHSGEKQTKFWRQPIGCLSKRELGAIITFSIFAIAHLSARPIPMNFNESTVNQ